MGQQQLLLVILVTVIVGLATVVAIDTFSQASESANLDAVRVDLGVIAGQAQAYYNKPREMGGGGRAFTGFSFEHVAFAYDSLNATKMMAMNDNALYNIESATDAEIVITAQPTSAGEMNFSNVTNTDLTLRAEIGTGTVDISFQN